MGKALSADHISAAVTINYLHVSMGPKAPSIHKLSNDGFMFFRYFLPIAILSLFLWTRCGSHSDPPITFTPLPESLPEQLCASDTLNDSYPFVYPEQILRYDSLLIVFDFLDRESVFHVFSDRDGRFLYSVGRKGNGPGEVIMPTSPTIDPTDRSLALWDARQKRLVRFRLPASSNDSVRYLDYCQNPSNSSYFSQIIAHDGSYYVAGHVDPLRFGKLEQDSVRVLYSDYPLLTSEDAEANRSVWNYAPYTRITSDGKRMVQSCYIGAALELFSIDNDRIHSDTVLAITPPRYRIVEGTRPRWVGTIDETLLGVLDVQISDRYIYALISQQSLTSDPLAAEGSAYIHVFDWSGRPVCRLKLSRLIECFSVDESRGLIYGIAFDEGSGEYQLLRINFNSNDFRS